VLEAAELAKMLEEKWGVSAAAAVAVTAAGPAAGAAVAPAEEQTEFTVILAAIGAKKIEVIKVVRAVTGLGLKEAKKIPSSRAQARQGGVTRRKPKDQVGAEKRVPRWSSRSRLAAGGVMSARRCLGLRPSGVLKHWFNERRHLSNHFAVFPAK
jgi:large subunit ribosomal protein L7/L12